MAADDYVERRGSTDDFSHYKELILSEIKELKKDFGSFKESTNTKVGDMQITLALLNQKMIMMSGISSAIVGTVVAFLMNKLLGS